MLSSINLPGGIQRRKSEMDELRMREFYREGEILCAEVQTSFSDGASGIHTRSQKYGKLVNGLMLVVSPKLVKRSRTHFLYPSIGIEIVLGLNGYVWVGKSRQHLADLALHDSSLSYSEDIEDLDESLIREIVLYAACIRQLNADKKEIDDASVVLMHEVLNQKQ